MSRSGYSDDCDGPELALWRGAVASAIKGKRGQALLRETLAALDAMPVKKLIAHELAHDGDYCTLGVVGQVRGIDITKLDPEDREAVAKAFNIAPALAAEIVYENDEGFEWVKVEICGPMRHYYPDYSEHQKTKRMPVEDLDARRWLHMRNWVAEQLKTEAAA